MACGPDDQGVTARSSPGQEARRLRAALAFLESPGDRPLTWLPGKNKFNQPHRRRCSRAGRPAPARGGPGASFCYLRCGTETGMTGRRRGPSRLCGPCSPGRAPPPAAVAPVRAVAPATGCFPAAMPASPPSTAASPPSSASTACRCAPPASPRCASSSCSSCPRRRRPRLPPHHHLATIRESQVHPRRGRGRDAGGLVMFCGAIRSFVL